MRILVTGANGFVGAAVVRHLSAAGHDVTGLVRVAAGGPAGIVAVGDLTAIDDFSPYLTGVEAIVHTAARVHQMRDAGTDALAAYRAANADLTRRLARDATAAGIRRFVFLSSIKVNGEATGAAPFDENDPPDPRDAYGVSKWESEQALTEIAADGRLAPVVLRLPLVYGPAVKANFRALMRFCDSSWPLPLGGISDNRRSLLYLGNLCAAIEAALALDAGGTYLLSDGEDLSTAALIRHIRQAFNRRARLIPVPVGVLRAAAALAGRQDAADRLCGSLQVDSSRFRSAAGWTPPFGVGQGLAATVAAHRRAR